MHTVFVTYTDEHIPKYLPGPFYARQIAENLGLRGIWGIHKVVTVALRLNFVGNTYTGEQAVAISKELQDVG